MATYQCTKCGSMLSGQSGTPFPKSTGDCPSTPTGNHIWQLVGRFIRTFINYF